MYFQGVFIVGGNIHFSTRNQGNPFTIPSNKHAEFNMFLDPLAAKMVCDSKLPITLIPWGAWKKATSFPSILKRLYWTKRTLEALFVQKFINRLQRLQKMHKKYRHMVKVLLVYLFIYLFIYNYYFFYKMSAYCTCSHLNYN